MEKLKFVLIGCGRIATLHVAGYKDREDAELWGVYDKNPQTAKRFAADPGIPKVYDSYEAVLADPEVTGVAILVPHHLHCELTIAACKAKKHVSVQKPMAMSLAECDKMIAAAKENGVLLKVFENFVHYPPYLLLKKMIAEGEIGEVVGIRYKMCNASLFSDNIPGAGARAALAGVKDAKDCERTGWKVDPSSWLWRLNDTLCGGGPAVFDDGYHKFSLFVDLLGEVEKVCAWIDETPALPGLMQDVPSVSCGNTRAKKSTAFGTRPLRRSFTSRVNTTPATSAWRSPARAACCGSPAVRRKCSKASPPSCSTRTASSRSSGTSQRLAGRVYPFDPRLYRRDQRRPGARSLRRTRARGAGVCAGSHRLLRLQKGSVPRPISGQADGQALGLFRGDEEEKTWLRNPANSK
jgi:predicted dehydrogenase